LQGKAQGFATNRAPTETLRPIQHILFSPHCATDLFYKEYTFLAPALFRPTRSVGTFPHFPRYHLWKRHTNTSYLLRKERAIIVHIFAHPIRVEFLFAQFSPYCKAFRGERAVITAKEPLFFSYFHPAEVFGLLFNGEARVFLFQACGEGCYLGKGMRKCV
jgi:hypothetical protein